MISSTIQRAWTASKKTDQFPPVFFWTFSASVNAAWKMSANVEIYLSSHWNVLILHLSISEYYLNFYPVTISLLSIFLVKLVNQTLIFHFVSYWNFTYFQLINSSVIPALYCILCNYLQFWPVISSNLTTFIHKSQCE